MRFFKLACLFGLVVASIGCVTDNFGRNSNAINADANLETSADNPDWQIANRKRSWLRPTGVEPKSREIEKSLGIY